MKKILAIALLFCLPLFVAHAQIKVKDLPTTTTGSTGDFLIKDDAAGIAGSTKKISVLNFVLTYLPTYITGTGTTNYVPKWTGAQSQGNSLIYDDGTHVDIGNTNATYKLDVTGTIRATSTIFANNTVLFGVPSSFTGGALFANSTNNNLFQFQAGITTSTLTFTLPTSYPTISNRYFRATTGGIMSFSNAHDSLTTDIKLNSLGRFVAFDGKAAFVPAYAGSTNLAVGYSDPSLDQSFYYLSNVAGGVGINFNNTVNGDSTLNINVGTTGAHSEGVSVNYGNTPEFSVQQNSVGPAHFQVGVVHGSDFVYHYNGQGTLNAGSVLTDNGGGLGLAIWNTTLNDNIGAPSVQFQTRQLISGNGTYDLVWDNPAGGNTGVKFPQSPCAGCILQDDGAADGHTKWSLPPFGISGTNSIFSNYGGNTATGTYDFVGGQGGNSSGFQTFNWGLLNIVSGNGGGGWVIGRQDTSSGDYGAGATGYKTAATGGNSHTIGFRTRATNWGAFAGGGDQTGNLHGGYANGISSFAHGIYAITANKTSQMILGSYITGGTGANDTNKLYVKQLNIGSIGLGGSSVNNLGVDASGNVVIGSSGISTPVSIANGGTNTNTQTTSGICYYDGTKITTGTALVFDGTDAYYESTVGAGFGTDIVSGSKISWLGDYNNNNNHTRIEVSDVGKRITFGPFNAKLNIGTIDYIFPSSQSANTYLKTDGSGNLSWSSAGAGTVTSFSAGNLSPLFTTSVATSTTTPALSFSLSTATSNKFLGGYTSGSASAPTYRSIYGVDLPATVDTAISLTTPNIVFATPVAFTKSGHTATGTLSLNTQSANKFFSGYTSGTATPTFRSIYGVDLPGTIDSTETLTIPSALFSASSLTMTKSGHTSAGTISLATQTANTVFAGATSGGAATPAFRALVAADIPSLPYSSSTLTNTHLFVGNGSNVATDVAASGDVTLANTGAFTIANLAVTNAKIANSTIDLTAKVTGTLPVGNGGTGIASYTTGDIAYASGSTTLSKLADVATGSVLVSGGTSTAPAYSATPTVTNINTTGSQGSEQMPALTTGNWTLGTGWQYLTSPNRIDKNVNGTGTVTPTAATTIVIGTTYKVTITVTAMSGSTATYTLGGVTGSALTSATTFTDTITASTTGNLIITPVATALRMTMSVISVIPLSNGNVVATGLVNASAGLRIGSVNIYKTPTTSTSYNTITMDGASTKVNFAINSNVSGASNAQPATLSIGNSNAPYTVIGCPIDGNSFAFSFPNSSQAVNFNTPAANTNTIFTFCNQGTASLSIGNPGRTKTISSVPIQFKATAAGAGLAAWYMPSGTLQSTTEAGAGESDGTNLYMSFANSGTRYTAISSGAPTIAAGTGAGTSPTVSIVKGTDMCHQVSVLTGAAPAGTNATVATITFNKTFGSTPTVVFSPANSTTALLTGVSMVYMDSPNATTYTITSGSTALTTLTTYIWNVTVKQ